MERMWMVRAVGGDRYDDFRERGVAAIGWSKLAAEGVRTGTSREDIARLYAKVHPEAKRGSLVAGTSQVWRFLNEVQAGDAVVTYSPSRRTYLLGRIGGPASYRPEWADEGMAFARPVAWDTNEVARDQLKLATRNSLGSTLTLFLVPEEAAADIRAVSSRPAADTPALMPDELVAPDLDSDPADPYGDIEEQARERIKDLINRLDWRDMQDLVAGILRAMGYKTQVSPDGADRGKDIIASPDGFGFENPRIVVEVKHHNGAMGSKQIRAFLGGRHKDDRGLYVSTGGFSRDARYEADRSSVPLTLWTLDNLVRALVEHYDNTDAETKRIVPLKRIYWPA